MPAEDGYDLEQLRKDLVGVVVVVPSFDPLPQKMTEFRQVALTYWFDVSMAAMVDYAELCNAPVLAHLGV